MSNLNSTGFDVLTNIGMKQPHASIVFIIMY